MRCGEACAAPLAFAVRRTSSRTTSRRSGAPSAAPTTGRTASTRAPCLGVGPYISRIELACALFWGKTINAVSQKYANSKVVVGRGVARASGARARGAPEPRRAARRPHRLVGVPVVPFGGGPRVVRISRALPSLSSRWRTSVPLPRAVLADLAALRA